MTTPLCSSVGCLIFGRMSAWPRLMMAVDVDAPLLGTHSAPGHKTEVGALCHWREAGCPGCRRLETGALSGILFLNSVSFTSSHAWIYHLACHGHTPGFSPRRSKRQEPKSAALQVLEVLSFLSPMVFQVVGRTSNQTKVRAQKPSLEPSWIPRAPSIAC